MIDHIEIDDYSDKGYPPRRKVTLSEFAGHLVVELPDGVQRVEVSWRDLKAAWEALRDSAR